MKTYRRLFVPTLIALGISLMTLSLSSPATAEPLSQQDYLSFDASVRNRPKEKRFTRVLQLTYGNRDLFQESFGTPGPDLTLRLSLKGKKGSITFRGESNDNVTVEEFNSKARRGQNKLVLLVKNGRCQVRTEPSEDCQFEVRVIKGRTTISDRIVASGSNGAEYDSGALDVSTGMLVIDGEQSN
jgi:hypothetical protein